MSSNLITNGSKSREYSEFSIQCFASFKEFEAYAELVKSKAGSELTKLLSDEQRIVENELAQGINTMHYGMFGKEPKSYTEAIERSTFVYKSEYERIKKLCNEKIMKALEKSSTAQAMKDRMVFNERELGEFIYERASMSLQPNLYFYSFTHKKVIEDKDIVYKSEGGTDTYYYSADNSEIFICVKITHENGEEEYIKSEGEETLKAIEGKGVLSIKSNVRKVYQFKEKQPRVNNAIKLFVGMTYGGYTSWGNDFYTGISAVMVAEYLQSVGYAVQIEVVIGGGRCGGCCSGGYCLNTKDGTGRRFFTITAKSFDEALDVDTLLYWVSDPSALHVKLLRYMNCFHYLYGDTLTFSTRYWHGIEKQDLINPIGAYAKYLDMKKGNNNLMYFLTHRVADEQAVVASVLDIVLTSENINLEINKKAIGNPIFE